MAHDEEWVLLRTFMDRSQARLFGEFLENQGLRVSIEGAFAAGVLPGVEQIRVMVEGARIDEARNASCAFDGDRCDELPDTQR